MGCTYRIYCIDSMLSYIGFTKRAAKYRFSQHKTMLKNGNHTNSHLQSDYNKYGIESFSYTVLDGSDTEQKWFEHFKPAVYNKWLHVKSPKGLKKPKHVIDALRAGNKRHWEENYQEMRKKCCRLTDEQVRDLRLKVLLTKRTYKDIGADYGVSAATVCLIHQRKRYSDVF